MSTGRQKGDEEGFDVEDAIVSGGFEYTGLEC